jgi:putative membrane protein
VSDGAAAGSEDGWHRLSPLSPVVRLGRGAIALVVILVPTLLGGSADGWSLGVYVVLLAVGFLAALVSWRLTRWRVHAGALQKEEGLLRRQSLRFPLTQIQAVDVLRPALARALGLAELRLRMGGATGGSARLAYLRTAEALELRGRLLSHGETEHETADAPRPEVSQQVLFRVSNARLVASYVLDLRNLLLIAVAIVVVAYAGPAGIIVWIAPGVLVAWRHINADYGRTVSEAEGGLHVEGGLVSTTAETIPRGRVQAVKRTEPLLWRPFGWCRLLVDLAGKQGSDHEAGDTTTRSARSLVPVGTRAEADALVRHLLPQVPAERQRAPARARLKAPLSYRHLAWGTNEAVAVTCGGRLERSTAWVPLEKVQSLRRVRGPVQQRLRLETIHLDTAGRGVGAALRDRDVTEGDAALRELIELCRRARSSAT